MNVKDTNISWATTALPGGRPAGALARGDRKDSQLWRKVTSSGTAGATRLVGPGARCDLVEAQLTTPYDAFRQGRGHSVRLTRACIW